MTTIDVSEYSCPNVVEFIAYAAGTDVELQYAVRYLRGF
jgi:hypothetical protein